MGKLTLNIDGFIGSWGYSKQWLNQMLTGREKDDLDIIISSPGGSVDHALAMHDRIVLHGNNSVSKVFGLTASAATVIACAAKERVMSSNSLYLVHKVLSWIDIFGYLNEDDIETLIQQLEKEKNENAKMTLVIARIYSNVTGKPVKDILNLMKQEIWLTAEEALEWGFITRIETLSGNIDFTDSKVALITAAGLPDPRNKTRQSNSKPPKKNNDMNRKFTHINNILGFEGIEDTADGVYFDLNQLETLNTNFDNDQNTINSLTSERDTAISERDTANQQRDTANQERDTAISERDTAISERDTANQERDTANQERDTANQERDTANTDLQNLINLLNAISPEVAGAETNAAKVAAIQAIIARKPGAKVIGTVINQDPETAHEGNVDWETIDSLPHNQGIV